MSYFSQSELKDLGFSVIGENVLLSRKASVYNAHRVSLGSNTRIDDFCVLSAGEGGIELGSHVHLGIMVSLIGRGRISVGDFSTLSGKVSVYSSSDDYSGQHMSNPTVPDDYKNVTHSDIEIGRHVIVGCGTVILPGAKISNGVSIGSLSLIKSFVPPDSVWAGVPARFLSKRHTEVYQVESEFLGRKIS